MIDNAVQTINGAVWNQSTAFRVGTGNLNPFLRIQKTPSEEGFNSDGSGIFDADAAWTKSLPLNHVPVITIGAVEYREFILDANEANSAPDGYFSIDQMDLWLCDDPGSPNFTTRLQFQGNTNCKSVYDLGGKVVLATDDLSKGSGSGYDYRILIPETSFEAAAADVGVSTTADCSYNGGLSAPCGAYLILDAKMGYKTGGCVESPGTPSCWITGATFEEFSTLNRPWVTVTKTAVPSFTRRNKWLINKRVSPSTITQFNGQSTDATWTITVTPDGSEDSNTTVSGSITVANTSGAAVTINSVSDAIPGYPEITPVCTGVTFPKVLADKSNIVCTYSVTPPDTDPGNHTNTATAVVVAALTDGDPTQPASFKGTANFNFANVTPTTIIDANPNVYDNSEGGVAGATTTLRGTASSSPISYTTANACGSTRTVVDVARLDLSPTGSATGDPTSSATLTINCLDLTVTKTAATTVNRNFLWTIEKSAAPTTWALFNGDQGTTRYTVTATPNGFSDTGLNVSGDITIHNPNSLPVYLQSLPTDAMTGSLAAVVTCPKVGTTAVFPYTLAAGGPDLICSYTRSLPDATNRTNTATVNAKPTNLSGAVAKDFTGTASVTPGTATPTETNRTVHVTDNFNNSLTATALGTATWGTGTTPGSATVFNPSHTFACAADAGTFVNVATITETSQTADARVTVNCYSLTVNKTAVPTYTKAWPWSVTKVINPTSTSLTLAVGELYQVGYTVQYTRGAGVESAWKVDGTITVSNTSPIAATIASLPTDVLSPAGTATVTCTGISFPYTLAATNGVLSCTYTKTLSAKTNQTNTATAVRSAYAYTYLLAQSANGTVNYSNSPAVNATFAANPTTAIDECANVSDDNAGTSVTGQICASQPFTYTKQLQYSVCGPYTVPNTASFTTAAGTSGVTNNNATPNTGSASVTINVTVTCPQTNGCTLTQGYWKTHNDSFKGGAPTDDNWLNIGGGVAENTGFFTTWSPSATASGPNSAPTFTWFNVFWTAPKGDPYYQLAHQYMAAKLNILNGASDAVISGVMTSANTFFQTAIPGTAWTKQQKSDIVSWAGTLGAYNEGGKLRGAPLHCSDDNSSSSAE